MYKRNGFNDYELRIKVKCLCFRKTQGMGAGRKLKSHRRRQRWANKSYRRNSILPNSVIRVQLIKNSKKIASFVPILQMMGHAVGDIPGVRFKVVKVFGVSLLALLKE
ncbi:putative ribosomal protein S12/S23 [Helianthus annuus]|uniref:Ribosomal protein S12/S23 n=1 Tax=Helianthus annuus TaxID=4232 RepID=A0A9K3H027_HELAN|nr:putative ribosomal protein S12/S23 [Helianthus annuus]KAJ0461660.1 putative ribosomal protein S12/S23 [Helianthus annuus]KAJ0645953.1 putative ribosomal protein S12/S23 [Helianthus annuus]KAJ0822557.1 putative ribosomal protein S12/S23 [Helianthus annuus]